MKKVCGILIKTQDICISSNCTHLVPALEGKGDADHVFHLGTPSNTALSRFVGKGQFGKP